MIADSSAAFTIPEAKTNRTLWRRLGRTFAAALRAIRAGMVASKDYRYLISMSDRQLGQLGLTRNAIPEELHRRHFAGLAGWPANTKPPHPRRE